MYFCICKYGSAFSSLKSGLYHLGNRFPQTASETPTCNTATADVVLSFNTLVPRLHCVVWEYLVQGFWLWCGLWSGLVPEHYTKMSWLGNSWSSKVAKWNARKSQSNRSVSGQTFPQYWLETPKYMLHHRSHCFWRKYWYFGLRI